MIVVLKFAAVFLISASIGILYRIPRSLLVYASIVGMAAWGITALTKEYGGGLIMANFFGSVIVGLAAETLARYLKKPAAIFIIPGFIPLVPGGEAYTTMLYMVEGRYVEGVSMFMRTVLTAGAIAFGIFISSTIYRLFINYITESKLHNVGKN
ncbi:threonine/serine exporter family protein [Dendrosporobacter sp. 1207_IL3150]|uniref:threonine/serine exporter family protein n=1 Tax=Dendrosporobacter sp. 1207_IL3150 TaxID=3084054 RepID=UPI002FDB0A90